MGNIVTYQSGDVYSHVILTGKCYVEKGNKTSRRIVEYICKCGKIGWTRLNSLSSGHTTSCGCEHIKSITTNSISRHPLNNVYIGMIRRCYDKRCKYYPNYGGRGVVVCDEWKNNIMSFFNWANENGWKKGLELGKDKLSPNKTGNIYSPEFCCFLTHKENSLHTSKSKKIEYLGEIKNLSEWCKYLRLPYGLTNQRISRDKWDIGKAFTATIKPLKNI